MIAEILPRQHGMHARQGAGRGDVDVQDAGMSVGTLQDGAVQHPAPREIRDVLGAAGDLLDRLELWGAAADCEGGPAQGALPEATASTASTILR